METETSDNESLDDLVFETRNKDYGAYPLRKEYPLNMISGLMITVFLVGLLIFVLYILSELGHRGGIVPAAVSTFELPTVLHPPPMIEIFEAHKSPPSQAKFMEVTPEVTTKPVETVSAELQEQVTPKINHEQPMESRYILPSVVVTPVASLPTTYCQLVQVSPVYEGGEKEMAKFIKRNIRFPRSAKDSGTSGTVLVSFVVNHEGKVVDVKVINGLSQDCDREAARVIARMPGWKAGIQNHQPVPVRMTLPIKFQLQDS
jgi:protein TonB